MTSAKPFQALVYSYSFHCSEEYFQGLKGKINQIVAQYKKKINIKISAQSGNFVLRSISNNEQVLIVFQTCPAHKDDQYFQIGIPLFKIKTSGYLQPDTSLLELFQKINQHLKNESLVFSDLEQKKIEEYTPILEQIIHRAYPQNNILKDFIVVFREHTLLSVLNLIKILRKYGLTGNNFVFYGKGDKCRNLERIEATFKKTGYKVFALSPFESISATGKTEDEKILPQSAQRLKEELVPIFNRAQKESKKIVLFDDGGLLITAILDTFPKYLDLITGAIESTKGGMNAIAARLNLPLPVVNLADSNIKNYMGTVVAHSITHRLREIIPHVRFLGETCVVVGYGVLGKPIAHNMRNLGLAVHVCEIDDIKILEAQSDGFPASKDIKKMFTKLHPRIILGCTGLDALNFKNLSLLPDGCYVATVSSNEVKQCFPKFDKLWKLNHYHNYGRVYTSPKGKRLTILADGASLNLFNAEGAVHADYQPFLASIGIAILFLAKTAREGRKLPNGLNTQLANKVEEEAKILETFVNFKPTY